MILSFIYMAIPHFLPLLHAWNVAYCLCIEFSGWNEKLQTWKNDFFLLFTRFTRVQLSESSVERLFFCVMIYTSTNIEDWIDCILVWHVMIKKSLIAIFIFFLRIGCGTHLQRSDRKWMMLQFHFFLALSCRRHLPTWFNAAFFSKLKTSFLGMCWKFIKCHS